MTKVAKRDLENGKLQLRCHLGSFPASLCGPSLHLSPLILKKMPNQKPGHITQEIMNGLYKNLWRGPCDKRNK